MEIIDDVLPALDGLGIAVELKAIRDFLDNCQPDFTRFMEEYGIHCPIILINASQISHALWRSMESTALQAADPAVSISFRISQDRRLFLSQHTSFVPRKKMH